ncbi:hypothetical protein TNCV_3442261 [Trichonephila clavipes]|nr:hypothetical protein TNCV_3442261 [Trichonephila clavipes]
MLECATAVNNSIYLQTSLNPEIKLTKPSRPQHTTNSSKLNPSNYTIRNKNKQNPEIKTRLSFPEAQARGILLFAIQFLLSNQRPVCPAAPTVLFHPS